MDVKVPGGERGNVQTGGGDRVSTISLLGCSTSIASAAGPNEKEHSEFVSELCCVVAKALFIWLYGKIRFRNLRDSFLFVLFACTGR